MKPLSKHTVSVVGLGQIGGSLAYDLLRRGLVASVVGFDQDPAASAAAGQAGAINLEAKSLEQAVSLADLVILALPIRQLTSVFGTVRDHLATEATVLDVAGCKVQVLRSAEQAGLARNYVGGHPMVGTEHIGFRAARPDLFQGANFILTPAREVNNERIVLIEELVAKFGARPLMMSAEEHDRIIARTSHLPYAIALCLVRLARELDQDADEIWPLIAGSFRSATRVSSSSPELTRDMLLSNRDEVTQALEAMIARLGALKEILLQGDEVALSQLVENARRWHQELCNHNDPSQAR